MPNTLILSNTPLEGAFNTDSSLLAVHCSNGIIDLWNPKSGKNIKSLSALTLKDELLFTAVYGQVDKMKEILKMNINVDSTINKGDPTALILSAIVGHEDLVRLLIDSGADVHAITKNAPISDGFSALIGAAIGNHIKIVKMLIEAGVNVNSKTNHGYTALMAAAQRGHKDIVILLLSSRSNVNARTTNGFTALFGAVSKRNKEIVQLLIEAGANINIKTDAGFSALSIAQKNDYEEIVNILLDGRLTR